MKRIYPKQVGDFSGKIFKNAKMNKVCRSASWRTAGYGKDWDAARQYYVNTFWKSFAIPEREKITKCNFTIEKYYNNYIWYITFGY